MYAQAVLPQDFNPFAPSAERGAPKPARTTRPAVSRKIVRRWVEVASWLAAPVGLAAFLLVH